MQSGTRDCSALLPGLESESHSSHPLSVLSAALLRHDKRTKIAWIESLVGKVVDERLQQRQHQRVCPETLVHLQQQVEALHHEVAALQDRFFSCADECGMLRRLVQQQADATMSQWRDQMDKLQDEMCVLQMQSTHAQFTFKFKLQEVQDDLRDLKQTCKQWLSPSSDKSGTPLVDCTHSGMAFMNPASNSEEPREESGQASPDHGCTELPASVGGPWKPSPHLNLRVEEAYKCAIASPDECTSIEHSTITLFSRSYPSCATTPSPSEGGRDVFNCGHWPPVSKGFGELPVKNSVMDPALG